MNIACIGDSITAGYPYSPGHSWPALLSARTSHRFWNLGVSGQTSAEILHRFPSELDSCQPELILLCAGTNDFIFTDTGPDQAAAHLAAMVQTAKNAGVIPVLWTPLLTIPKAASLMWTDQTDYHRVNCDLVQLRQEILHLGAQKNFSVIDAQTAFAQKQKEAALSDASHTLSTSSFALYLDGIHPTIRGYEILSQIILDGLPL